MVVAAGGEERDCATRGGYAVNAVRFPSRNLEGADKVKIIATSVVTLFVAACVFAQSSPDLHFNGHTLGETAETFFFTATTLDSKAKTKDYCKALLDDPIAMKRYEESKSGANKKEFLFSDVGGCQQVMAALRGERAPVGARLASELGKGRVLFVGGKLFSLTLDTERPYANVVADMTKRFGISGHNYTRKVGGGPGIEGMRWNVGRVTALVFKLPYHDDASIYVGYEDQPSDGSL